MNEINGQPPGYIRETGVDLAPLVVDLDGTLTPTDTLFESVLLAIKRRPSTVFCLAIWLLQGRAGFKARVAERARPQAVDWPYRTDLVDYLRAEKLRGRRLVLATAAHHSTALSVAAHLDLFDAVLASDETRNLKGAAKLAAIRASEGERFAYAGDSSADLPVWKMAQAAILVGTSETVAAKVRAAGTPIEREFSPGRAGFGDWLRALRVHQWLKNALLFVPLLTAFAFADMHKVFAVAVAFVAFCLAASATYIGNDLWDLQNDRRHPRKCNRPFASGRISIIAGVLMAGFLLSTSFLLAATQSSGFLALLALYVVLTTTYSWVLKTYILIDVLMLALLYTLRIVAGAAAAGIQTSVWLLAFSVFIFLSLALVKRCAELVTLGATGAQAAHGRDYRVSDLVVLWPMGVGAGLCAVVVFTLFASAPDVSAKYATPQLLWLVAVGLVYWLGRLWIKTARGVMHDDPLVFAIRDFGSRVTIAAMLGTVIIARFSHFGW